MRHPFHTPRRALVAAFVVILTGALAVPALGETGRSRSVSRVERLILGPEHAAEHAGMRWLAKAQAVPGSA